MDVKGHEFETLANPPRKVVLTEPSSLDVRVETVVYRLASIDFDAMEQSGYPNLGRMSIGDWAMFRDLERKAKVDFENRKWIVWSCKN